MLQLLVKLLAILGTLAKTPHLIFFKISIFTVCLPSLSTKTRSSRQPLGMVSSKMDVTVSPRTKTGSIYQKNKKL